MQELTTIENYVPAEMTPATRLEEWLSSLNTNTRRAYTGDLESFRVYVGAGSIGCALEMLCTNGRPVGIRMLEQFREALKARGLSPAAINRPITVVNSALRHLAKAEYGPGPLDVKGVKAEAVKDNRGPEGYELAHVIAQLEAGVDARSKRDLAIVRLAAQRGLRRSEIAELSLEDLNLDAGEISVKRKGKSQKAVIRLSPVVTQALRDWLACRQSTTDDAVFLTICGRADQSDVRLSAHAIYKMVRSLGRSSSRWRPHGLRHAAISSVLMQTGNLEAARVLAGHASVSTTQRYIDDKAGLEGLALAALEGSFK